MRVLIALDDTPYSQHMLDLVMRRHWPADTEFKVLHVIEPICAAESASDWAAEGCAQMQSELEERRHKYFEKLCSEARHKIEHHVPGSIVHFEIRKGRAHKQIVAAAAEWEAHKIIIGAHGHAVCPHNLMGSVSRSVAERAHCTVEVVRHGQGKKLKEETVGAAASSKK